MRDLIAIERLLDALDTRAADALEDQDLDFKRWPSSPSEAVAQVVEMAVCMANGGSGTVVFGVDDKAVGRARAILGVPPEADVSRLKKHVYDSTDPKLTPVFEELLVPEGTGRLLVMQVYGGLPPYTDTKGGGKIRVGRDCQPLTGTLRRQIGLDWGVSDFTAVAVPGDPSTLLSAVALEELRGAARRENAPEDLWLASGLDLLGALGVLRDGWLTRAGVLLAGSEDAIARHVPNFSWAHLRMRSDTEYSDPLRGRTALPVALARLTERVMTDNPIDTVVHGMFHFEYRTYPEIALREALMNALCHADYRLGGQTLVRQYPDRLEISNPGGLVGGIAPDNILHHPPVARNPLLVEALTRLRLINRSNLGVPRMFRALLEEGKEPPHITQPGEAVVLTLLARPVSVPMRLWVAEQADCGRLLTVDHLLILQYLLRHGEVDVATAARLCQRDENAVRETLSEMERTRGYLERGGTGRGTYWVLGAELHWRLAQPEHYPRDRRLDWEAMKVRVLSMLRRRALAGERGLTNAEVRAITRLDRDQVKRLLDELRADGQTRVTGRGRMAAWEYHSEIEPDAL
jgi:ATP-dependent DNA helicase RecG